MIVKVFGIYDSKAEAYLPPFFMKSKVRLFVLLQHMLMIVNIIFVNMPKILLFLS